MKSNESAKTAKTKPMKDPRRSTKLSPETMRLLRIVAAVTNETYSALLERLLTVELKKLKAEKSL